MNNRSCWDGELLVDMVRAGARVKYLNQDLALFRIHAKSITGSRRHGEMMKADSERMFSLSRGRKWTALDTAARLFVSHGAHTHPSRRGGVGHPGPNDQDLGAGVNSLGKGRKPPRNEHCKEKPCALIRTGFPQILS